MVLDGPLREHIHANQGRFIEDIARLAAQPSISAKKEGIEECAQLTKKMIEEAGGKTKVLRIDGASPLVFGEFNSSRSGKTILFYNHYDVQPAEPLALWKSPPFKPEIRDGRMYGRGVSDDKGHLVSRLKLLESYMKVHGEPPCNIKFCFEGEEEVGSGHLHEYIDSNLDLFRADAMIWEYGNIDNDGRPVVSLGVKGMLYLELTVNTLSRDVHSAFAAVLPSPAWRLVRLLNLIKNEDERVLIPGWYDQVQELSEDELRILDAEPSDAGNMPKTYGATGFAGHMSLPQAKMALAGSPTGNIAGMWTGYTDVGLKTVLPAQAHCRIDFRLVKDQDPDALYRKFVDFLRVSGFPDVEAKVLWKERAARTSYKDPWVQSTLGAAEEVFGKKAAIEIGSPGTGPLAVFTSRYNIPAVMIGMAPYDDGIHGPNENIRLDYLENSMLWAGQTIEDYVKGK